MSLNQSLFSKRIGFFVFCIKTFTNPESRFTVLMEQAPEQLKGGGDDISKTEI